MLKKSTKYFCYAIYLLAVAIIFDVVILRYLLGIGYPTHLEQENILRYPTPYVEFNGKPGTNGHNSFGFLGPSLHKASECDLKIAFFAGSTGYNGNPPIPVLLEKKLKEKLGSNVFLGNYSMLSANHRQHLHAMIEYIQGLETDIVIFYGGFNETLQSAYFDPRPGYPYNFFYRGETSPFIKVLMENSALFGELDQRTGIFTGLNKLQEQYQPFSREWNTNITDHYFETLKSARELSGILPSSYFDAPVFIAFYQPYQIPKEFKQAHKSITQRLDTVDYIHDVSSLYDKFGQKVYTDMVHVLQYAREAMAARMADEIAKKMLLNTPDKHKCR